MVSFDVKSLFHEYSNLAHHTTHIRQHLQKRWQRMQWPQQKPTKKLLTWSTQNTTFRFDNKFYKQLDGVAMGSPIGSLMADVIMNYVIGKAFEITPYFTDPASSADTWMTVLPPSLNQPLLTFFSIT